MPEADGIELCQIIRSDPCWSWLPILLLTAYTSAEIRDRVVCSRGQRLSNDYLTKPIATVELVQRILNRLNRTQFLRT